MDLVLSCLHAGYWIACYNWIHQIGPGSGPRQYGPPALMNEDVSWLPSGGDLSLMVYSMEQIHLTPLPLPPPPRTTIQFSSLDPLWHTYVLT